MSDDNLSKAELALIDRIIESLGLSRFKDLLWSKVESAFNFVFHHTQVSYGFAHATPDERALKYLEERVFILSDKTRDRLTGDLRWELLEGIRNTESIDEIKRRLDTVFEVSDVNTERIARTETLNAMAEGRFQANVESGVALYKQWRAAMNNPRTAADSKRLHGQIQKIEDPFVDPKTGDECMHNPNRPNCRCTVIYLRKLPLTTTKNGQMYAADEVGKIEINLGSLIKTEKRVWVKATAKRKGHYRKIKGAKKVEDVVDKSDTMLRIEKIVPIVQLSGISEDKLNSVASALENTLGQYSTNVEVIRFATSDDIERNGKFGAMLTSKFDPEPVSIVINEDITDDKWFTDRYKKRSDAIHSIKETQIEYFEDAIKLGMGEKEEYEDKLKGYKAMNRSSVDVDVKDHFKCVIEHEGFHAIDFKNAVSSSPTVAGKYAGIFLEALEKNGVTFEDKCKVSEYAARNDTELWAEVGSAMLNDVSVPESIKKAFNDTLLDLKEGMKYGSSVGRREDEVKKIEINLGSLQKTKKRVWVKATAKRKGHYRRIKGAKEVEEKVETKSVMDRLKSIIPNVRFDGATEDQLESITIAVEETFAEFPSVKVDAIGWLTPDDMEMQGFVDAAYLGSKRHDKIRLAIRKEVATDIVAWGDNADDKFVTRKKDNQVNFQTHIDGFGNWGELDKVAEYEEKLENLNACPRLLVALSQEDKLKAIMIHECYHAIGDQMKLEDVFSEQLEKIGVTKKDKMSVSDYGASSDLELWAEVGLAIDSGVDIPDSVRHAFENTMETIR